MEGSKKSTHERLLKESLILRHAVHWTGKNRSKMRHRLEKRIGKTGGGSVVLAAQKRTNGIEPETKPGKQMINCFQRKRGRQSLGCRFNGRGSEQLAKQLPEKGGSESVARQNVSKVKGKGAATASALASVGTKDPLPPDDVCIGRSGIVAIEKAVPVQRLVAVAAWTALLLERKR